MNQTFAHDSSLRIPFGVVHAFQDESYRLKFFHHLLQRQTASGIVKDLLERLPVHVFHDDIGGVIGSEKIFDGDDVGIFAEGQHLVSLSEQIGQAVFEFAGI